MPLEALLKSKFLRKTLRKVLAIPKLWTKQDYVKVHLEKSKVRSPDFVAAPKNCLQMQSSFPCQTYALCHI